MKRYIAIICAFVACLMVACAAPVEITLEWDSSPASELVTGYHIFVWREGEAAVVTTVQPTTTLRVQASIIVAEDGYYFAAVSAYNDVFESPACDAIRFATIAGVLFSPPSAPLRLSQALPCTVVLEVSTDLVTWELAASAICSPAVQRFVRCRVTDVKP